MLFFHSEIKAHTGKVLCKLGLVFRSTVVLSAAPWELGDNVKWWARVSPPSAVLHSEVKTHGHRRYHFLCVYGLRY